MHSSAVGFHWGVFYAGPTGFTCMAEIPWTFRHKFFRRMEVYSDDAQHGSKDITLIGARFEEFHV